MENRLCYRLPVEIDVWLYQDDLLFAKAKILNVCRNGMYIRTNVMLLPKFSKLDVVFEIQEAEELKRVSFPVTVIHRCLEGIGVKIDKMPNMDEASVISLLSEITTKSYLEEQNNFAA